MNKNIYNNLLIFLESIQNLNYIIFTINISANN